MVYCTEKTKISKENLKHKEEGSSIKKREKEMVVT
jgi:hypothetical protein